MVMDKQSKQRARRLHNPERARERLLQAAFREVYRSGFRSASLDAILGETGVTKGALYYHFDGKQALGHAIVEEVIADLHRDKWLRSLRSGGEPFLEGSLPPSPTYGRQLQKRQDRGTSTKSPLRSRRRTWTLGKFIEKYAFDLKRKPDSLLLPGGGN